VVCVVKIDRNSRGRAFVIVDQTRGDHLVLVPIIVDKFLLLGKKEFVIRDHYFQPLFLSNSEGTITGRIEELIPPIMVTVVQ
jgi:hypothetical protein